MRRPYAAVLLAVLGCASTPLPAPSSEQACVVGVQLRVEDPIRHTTTIPETVYFVRFDEGGNPTRMREALASTVRRGSTFLLLDAAPGRYAVVGSHEWRDGKRIATLFGADCIRESEAQARPGTVVFLGRGRVRTATRAGLSDEAQRHYFGVLVPDLAGATDLKRIFGRDRALLGRAHSWKRDAETEADFLGVARSVLGDSDWARRLP